MGKAKTHVAAKTKKDFDHAWPRQRSLNIEKMIKRMKKDEAYVFELAQTFLHDYSDIPWKLGDHNAAILIAWIATQMGNKKLDIQRSRRKLNKGPRRR